MFKKLINKVKFIVWSDSEPLLRKLVLNKKGVGARLCQAKFLPPKGDFAGIEITHDATNIPLNEPLFNCSGIVENQYINRLNLIKNSEKNITEPCGIISASNVNVSFPNSIHHWRGKIFEEVIPNSVLIFSNPKYVLSSELIPFSRKKRMPEAIMLSMPLYHNFYHWMIEILPRLAILKKTKEDLSCLPIVMPKQHPKFVKDSLVISGFIHRILFIDDGVARFNKLHLLTKISQQNAPSPIAVEWLRKTFIKYAEKTTNMRRIYVSRRDANSRYVTNESDVEKLLFNYGFETICMSCFSLENQINIFQEAEIIIGSHGAAFANLVFTPAKSVFIELFSPHHLNHCFYHISGIRKLKYGFLVGTPNGRGFSINLYNLKNLLDKAMKYL